MPGRGRLQADRWEFIGKHGCFAGPVAGLRFHGVRQVRYRGRRGAVGLGYWCTVFKRTLPPAPRREVQLFC
jgi:hypothetical protein